MKDWPVEGISDFRRGAYQEDSCPLEMMNKKQKRIYKKTLQRGQELQKKMGP